MRGRWIKLLLLFVAVLTTGPGCRVLRAPQKMVEAVVPGNTSKQPDPVELQVQVQRFADDYAMQTSTAVDESVRRLGTEAAKVQGLHWKLAVATAALGFASGPQPKANLLDLVSLATLNHAALEARVLHSADQHALQPWLETSRMLESNAWGLAERVLSPAQVRELRDAIAQWQEQNPGAKMSFAARPAEFASLVKASPRRQADVNSVFSLVGLDPTSGLDPAVHEITLTRLFAERAMFTLQRMPQVVRWQAELLTYQVTEQPGAQRLLTNAARLSESMDRISQTAAQLPDRVTEERKAVLAALDAQEGKLRNLAVEVERSISSAERMSGSLTITITNFDALMKRFGVGEPGTDATPSTNSKPFNILDYGETATQIAGMARELNTLMASANQSVPQVERLGAQASVDAQRLVDLLFWRGLILILALVAGLAITGLIYRIIVSRITQPRLPSSSAS